MLPKNASQEEKMDCEVDVLSFLPNPSDEWGEVGRDL